MARKTYAEFVAIRGTDLTVVVHAVSLTNGYELTGQVLRQPKGQGTTVVADNLRLGRLVKDTDFPTSEQWVATIWTEGSIKTRVTWSPTLSSALWAVGRTVGHHYARQEA